MVESSKGDLTLVDCDISGSANQGGCLYNTDTGRVNATRTAFSGTASQGGSIFNAGLMTLSHCDVHNSVAAFGGGIYNVGTLHVASSSFSGNRATGSNQNECGGGIYNVNSVYLKDTYDPVHSWQPCSTWLRAKRIQCRKVAIRVPAAPRLLGGKHVQVPPVEMCDDF